MALLSQQALVYLYDTFAKESAKENLPIQAPITIHQIEKLQGIIVNAENAFFGIKPYKEILHQVCFILYEINRQHILMDGNKRFSLWVGYYLLQQNQIDPDKIVKADWEMFIMRLASDREFGVEQAFDYLKEKI